MHAAAANTATAVRHSTAVYDAGWGQKEVHACQVTLQCHAAMHHSGGVLTVVLPRHAHLNMQDLERAALQLQAQTHTHTHAHS
jgi:hypothetical protein